MNTRNRIKSRCESEIKMHVYGRKQRTRFFQISRSVYREKKGRDREKEGKGGRER